MSELCDNGLTTARISSFRRRPIAKEEIFRLSIFFLRNRSVPGRRRVLRPLVLRQRNQLAISVAGNPSLKEKIMAGKGTTPGSSKPASVKVLEKKAGVLNTKQMKQKDVLAKAKEELATTTTELRELKAQIKAVKRGS